MKKTILLSLAILVFAICNAQTTKGTSKGQPSTNTQSKQNIIAVPVIDRIDTIQVENLLYKDADSTNHLVRWCSPGYYIRQGKIRKDPDGKIYWCDEQGNYVNGPLKLIGALDNNKKPVKPL